MNILIGITGGIAIYKVLNVIRMLIRLGHEVRVIMTESAIKFIQPILFKAISGNPVYVTDFDYSEPLAHINLAEWGDVFAIIPATANTIAKLAQGIADNLLTSTFLASTARKMVFPSMNVNMYQNPFTQQNLATLAGQGNIEVVEPAEGSLACNTTGKGRLPDEEYIVGVIDRLPQKPLHGKRYIVTAGGTIERIDPVRYLSNFSSGRMGIELARALYRYGADVFLIYAQISVPLPCYLPAVEVASAVDMLSAIQLRYKDYDGIFMAAAPADFHPKEAMPSKIKKSLAPLELNLIPTIDIIKTVTAQFPDKFALGFALETENFIDNAKQKLKDKGLDYIVLNRVESDFSPLGNEQSRVTLISAGGVVKEHRLAPKSLIAEWIVRETLMAQAN